MYGPFHPATPGSNQARIEEAAGKRDASIPDGKRIEATVTGRGLASLRWIYYSIRMENPPGPVDPEDFFTHHGVKFPAMD